LVYVLIVCRLVLAIVFVTAAIGKLASLAASRQAVLGFGVPERLAGPIGNLLPFAELAVGIMLLGSRAAWWGAIGAILLLVAFIAGICVNLVRGHKPNCHCFGQFHSQPVSWATAFRNAALAALAAWILLKGRQSSGPAIWQSLLALPIELRVGLFVGIVLLTVCVFTFWFNLQIFRQNGRLLQRIEGLEQHALDRPGRQRSAPIAALHSGGLATGAIAPQFRLPDLRGEFISLDNLLAAAKPLVVLFIDPGCGSCTALLPTVIRWQSDYADRMTVAVLSTGSSKANQAKIGKQAIKNYVLQTDREVAQLYQCHGTPGASLIGADGLTRAPLAMGADAIKALVESVADGSAILPAPALAPQALLHRALSVGEMAPSFELPDLTGEQIRLTHFQGRSIALLFWNPRCGFCARMLSDLKAWESQVNGFSPKLVVVSTGTVEVNKQLGLRSTVVLEQKFRTGHAFGVGGTPSAVLIGPSGKIETQIIAGAAGILELLRSHEFHESE
jgi:peroxiredoxin